MKRWPSRGHPIAPTEFFKDRSAPEARSAGPRRPTTPRLQHAVLKRRIPRSRSHRPRRIDGYRPWLTPRNLTRILAKGQSSTDLIHTQSTQVFGSFGQLPTRRVPEDAQRAVHREATAWTGTRWAARSAKGRRPGKYETGLGHHTDGRKRCFREGAGGRSPDLSALSKGPARRPGTGPPPRVPKTSWPRGKEGGAGRSGLSPKI